MQKKEHPGRYTPMKSHLHAMLKSGLFSWPLIKVEAGRMRGLPHSCLKAKTEADEI